MREGELTSANWVNAIGSTMSAALTQTKNFRIVEIDPSAAAEPNFASMMENSLKNLLIGGALSALDRDAAFDFIQNSVGNEVGQFIGGSIVEGMKGFAANRANAVQDQAGDDLARFIAEATGMSEEKVAEALARSGTITYDDSKGLFVDGNGNPVIMLASNFEPRELEDKVLLKSDALGTGSVSDEQLTGC